MRDRPTRFIRQLLFGDFAEWKNQLRREPELATMLMENNSTALMHACYILNLEAVKLLVEAGANIAARDMHGQDVSTYLSRPNIQSTPATRKKQEDIADYLAAAANKKNEKAASKNPPKKKAKK